MTLGSHHGTKEELGRALAAEGGGQLGTIPIAGEEGGIRSRPLPLLQETIAAEAAHILAKGGLQHRKDLPPLRVERVGTLIGVLGHPDPFAPDDDGERRRRLRDAFSYRSGVMQPPINIRERFSAEDVPVSDPGHSPAFNMVDDLSRYFIFGNHRMGSSSTVLASGGIPSLGQPSVFSEERHSRLLEQLLRNNVQREQLLKQQIRQDFRGMAMEEIPEGDRNYHLQKLCHVQALQHVQQQNQNNGQDSNGVATTKENEESERHTDLQQLQLLQQEHQENQQHQQLKQSDFEGVIDVAVNEKEENSGISFPEAVTSGPPGKALQPRKHYIRGHGQPNLGLGPECPQRDFTQRVEEILMNRVESLLTSRGPSQRSEGNGGLPDSSANIRLMHKSAPSYRELLTGSKLEHLSKNEDADDNNMAEDQEGRGGASRNVQEVYTPTGKDFETSVNGQEGDRHGSYNEPESVKSSCLDGGAVELRKAMVAEERLDPGAHSSSGPDQTDAEGGPDGVIADDQGHDLTLDQEVAGALLGLSRGAGQVPAESGAIVATSVSAKKVEAAEAAVAVVSDPAFGERIAGKVDHGDPLGCSIVERTSNNCSEVAGATKGSISKLGAKVSSDVAFLHRKADGNLLPMVGASSPGNFEVPLMVDLPPKRCDEYTIFFQLERARLLQAYGIFDVEAATPHHDDPLEHPRPIKYRHVVMPPYWYCSHKAAHDSKLKYLMREGRIELQTLSKSISAGWQYADNEVIEYCRKLALAPQIVREDEQLQKQAKSYPCAKPGIRHEQRATLPTDSSAKDKEAAVAAIGGSIFGSTSDNHRDEVAGATQGLIWGLGAKPSELAFPPHKPDNFFLPMGGGTTGTYAARCLAPQTAGEDEQRRKKAKFSPHSNPRLHHERTIAADASTKAEDGTFTTIAGPIVKRTSDNCSDEVARASEGSISNLRANMSSALVSPHCKANAFLSPMVGTPLPGNVKVPRVAKIPPKPYTEYTIFFRLERARLLQCDGIFDDEAATHLDHHDPIEHPRPAKFRNVVMPPYWYSSSHKAAQERKRKHRKRAGRMDLQTLSKSISAAWRNADKEVIEYCRNLARTEHKKYNQLLGPLAAAIRRRPQQKLDRSKSTKTKGKLGEMPDGSLFLDRPGNHEVLGEGVNLQMGPLAVSGRQPQQEQDRSKSDKKKGGLVGMPDRSLFLNCPVDRAVLGGGAVSMPSTAPQVLGGQTLNDQAIAAATATQPMLGGLPFDTGRLNSTIGQHKAYLRLMQLQLQYKSPFPGSYGME